MNPRNQSNANPLYLAANRRQQSVAKLLIAHHANVSIRDSVYGCTPLHHACSRGDQDVVEALLAAGADINARDKNGQTPLSNAISQGQTGLVGRLVARGADIRSMDRTRPSESPVLCDRPGLSGSGPGASDVRGRPRYRKDGVGAIPLHVAARTGNLDTMRLLIDAGAEVNTRDGRNACHASL